MSKLVLIVLIFGICSSPIAMGKEAGDFLTSCNSTNLHSLLLKERSRLRDAKAKLKQVKGQFQKKGIWGEGLTLIYPEAFKGQVITWRLALNCWMQLDESLRAKTKKSEDADPLFKNWQSCVKDLYENNLPPLAQQIVACTRK